jgi:hypothetical protein
MLPFKKSQTIALLDSDSYFSLIKKGTENKNKCVEFLSSSCAGHLDDGEERRRASVRVDGQADLRLL